MFNLNRCVYEKVFSRNDWDNGACPDGMRKCGICRKCGRMTNRDALMYMVFQVIGGIIGSLILVLLISTGGHGGPTISGAN